MTPCVRACLDGLGIPRAAYRVACTPIDIVRIAGRNGYRVRRHTSWNGRSVATLLAALDARTESSGWLLFVTTDDPKQADHVMLAARGVTIDTMPRERSGQRIVLAWRMRTRHEPQKG